MVTPAGYAGVMQKIEMNKIIILMACVFLSACGPTQAELQKMQDNHERDLLSWRIALVSVDMVDAFYNENSPFGKYNPRQLSNWDQWKIFISNYKTGDELWYYRTPKEYWASLSGEEGFAIYRQGKLISRIITALN